MPHLARYWSTDFKNNCPVLDDTEGISLRSVGGIFIGSVTGFALAMLVFLVEVVFFAVLLSPGQNLQNHFVFSEMGSVEQGEEPGMYVH